MLIGISNMTLVDTLFEHFSDIRDPRIHNHNFRHNIFDMLVIAVLATICGADSWVEIERFGEAKFAWLSTFLKLPQVSLHTILLGAYFLY